jgi:hypothetical protein
MMLTSLAIGTPPSDRRTSIAGASFLARCGNYPITKEKRPTTVGIVGD